MRASNVASPKKGMSDSSTPTDTLIFENLDPRVTKQQIEEICVQVIECWPAPPFPLTTPLNPSNIQRSTSFPLFVSYCYYFQASPVMDIHMPLDSTGQYNQGYAIVRYQDIEAAAYAWRLFLDIVFLHGRPVNIKFYSLSPHPPPPPSF